MGHNDTSLKFSIAINLKIFSNQTNQICGGWPKTFKLLSDISFDSGF